MSALNRYDRHCVEQMPLLENAHHIGESDYNVRNIDYTLQINFIIKEAMRTRLDRKIDKENSFNADQLPRSRTPKVTKAPLTPSNSELRKKLDENLANFQKLSSHDRGKEAYQNGQIDNESKNGSFIIKGKRQNAKNRGFDMKVNNIVAINDKINSLLNMVKKEKNIERTQKLEKLEKERAVNRSRELDSPNVDLKQKIKKEQPSVSPFIKDRYETKEETHYTPKIDKKYMFSEARQEQSYQEPSKRFNDSYVYSRAEKEKVKEEPAKQLNLKQLRRKYLPEDEKPTHKSKKKEQVSWESSFAELQEYKYQKIEQKQVKVESDSSAFKSKNIDKMLEERKRKREQERQEERIKFQKASMNNSMQRESKLSIPTYEQEKSRSFQQSNVSQKAFVPQINTAENPRNQKINATTRLIDEQIQRIKSKIQQSENNNQKNQIKLQSGPSQNHKRSQSINQHVEEKEHTARIATKISGQVQLDNLLRQARVAFEKVPGDEKWKKLQEELEVKGMKISLNFLKELIRVSSDQHNPFAADPKDSQGLTDLANLFINSQTNWEDYVCGCTSMKKLIEQGYNTEDLDLSQKGSLSVEDIVCFVNLYTGHFYRNRDLALIFRRLQLQTGEAGNNLSYEGFEKALSV